MKVVRSQDSQWILPWSCYQAGHGHFLWWTCGTKIRRCSTNLWLLRILKQTRAKNLWRNFKSFYWSVLFCVSVRVAHDSLTRRRWDPEWITMNPSINQSINSCSPLFEWILNLILELTVEFAWIQSPPSSTSAHLLIMLYYSSRLKKCVFLRELLQWIIFSRWINLVNDTLCHTIRFALTCIYFAIVVLNFIS